MSLSAVAVALMFGQAAPDAPANVAALPSSDVAVAGSTQPSPAEPGATGAATAPADPAAPTIPATPADATGAALPAPPAGSEGTPPGDEESTIVVTAGSNTPGDPLEHLNAQSFQAVQAVDKAVVEPVAKAYNKGLPRPVRKGLRNFFSNLGEPVVFAAYLLQFKPGKAAETAGRFAINTTLGIAGIMDVAKRKPFNLPYRPNGVANVLGYYGVGPGPYMYLPIVGPTTLRDIIGDTVDKLLLPAAVGKPFNKPAFVIPATVLAQLGERAAFDETIGEIRKDEDPYTTYRDLYLRQRAAEIEALHGRHLQNVVPVYGPALPTPGGKETPAPEKAPEPGPGQTPAPASPPVPAPDANPAPAAAVPQNQ
ncbi:MULTISPECIES: VacJ family lipoprotein [unclassified Novosphingobium]|uniref:MlaA family lipoprotein n=1 Tax=unclassified Novosphingobium TaxID=2644732 RepID=UPI0006CC45DF|nr:MULTISPECIES: VacJ family lipoprotein [unclassified Novosphingobium]KPH63658.1 lipoprotein [Novosphingobium sp. ST904]MPS69760.1 VacJ family lipoprotein [Novosphingobium sp.]TCM36077.1 phospholipid-binding lipoprotein MlaA [Novosphingobium sp. ST904]